MFNFARTAGLAAVAAVSMTAAAEAATVYASAVTVDVVGTNAQTIPGRDDPAASLGAPDTAWYSLGLGGAATYTFLPTSLFMAPGAVIEITKGSRDNHVESLDVYGILAGIPTLIAQIINNGTNDDAVTYSFGFAGMYDSLQLVDTSSGGPGGSFDGFDVESVSVTAPIPVPAGGILLLSALGGIAALRRRKA